MGFCLVGDVGIKIVFYLDIARMEGNICHGSKRERIYKFMQPWKFNRM